MHNLDRDTELLVMRNTKYAHLSPSAAYNAIARAEKLNVDSVRARINRVMKVPSNLLTLMEEVALNPPTLPTSVRRQEAVFHDAREEFQFIRRSQSNLDTIAMFASDAHYPKTRFDAVDLMLQIAEYAQPTYFSAENDFADNEGYGRWGDTRAPHERIFSQDLANIKLGTKSFIGALRAAAPKVKMLQVRGNHEAWLFSHHRTHEPQSAEETIADYTEFMQDLGVLMFTSTRENYVELSNDLVWVHGIAGGENPIANGKRAMRQFMKDGRVRKVVQGHTHRVVQLNGSALGYPGGEFVNSGALCHSVDVQYMKHDPSTWELAIVISKFNESEGWSENTLVPFVKRGSKLTAKYDGYAFETPIKDEPYNARTHGTAY